MNVGAELGDLRWPVLVVWTEETMSISAAAYAGVSVACSSQPSSPKDFRVMVDQVGVWQGGGEL